MFFKSGFQTLENIDSFFDAGLVDINLLETARQRMILLENTAVFLKGGRADALEFTGSQHRFHQVRGIHDATGCGAGTDNSVDFVNKEYRPFFFS